MYRFDMQDDGDKTILTGKSAIKGQPIRMVVDKKAYEKYLNGAKVQDAFPDMSREEREILISGITPQEWDELFP